MGSKKKGLWILIVIAVILFMVNPRTIKYLKAKIGSDKGEISTVKEIETPHSSQIVYKKFDSGLIKCWEGVLVCYNMAGEQLWSMNLAVDRPTIKTNADSIYVIDENKNQILRINKKGEQIYKNTLDKGYKNFNICDNNYVVLHHDTEEPVQYITVMDEKGKKASEIILGEGEITNVAVSKECDRIAISTMDVSGDNLENSILIYDLSANLLSSESFDDNVILDIFYNEKGKLIAIDEKNIFGIDGDGSIDWKIGFDGPIAVVNAENKNFMTAYSKGSNKNSVIYTPTENAIKIFSYDGKLLGKTNQKEEIINIDSYKNSIIVHSPRTIFKYNRSGNLKMEYPYNSDILKCFALSDNNIAIITKEKISFLSLKGI